MTTGNDWTPTIIAYKNSYRGKHNIHYVFHLTRSALLAIARIRFLIVYREIVLVWIASQIIKQIFTVGDDLRTRVVLLIVIVIPGEISLSIGHSYSRSTAR